MATTPTRNEAGMTERFIDDYLPYLLAQASHLACRRFDVYLKPLGITHGQWRVLQTLDDSGPLSVGELEPFVLGTQSAVSKTVDRMERDGLVARAALDSDRRRVRVSITEEGRALVARLRDSARLHEAAVLAATGGADAEALKAALKAIIRRFDEDALLAPDDERAAATGH